MMIKTQIKKPDVRTCAQACASCRIGSCCYEGAELSLAELKKIMRYRPQVRKPWFRLVESKEGIDRGRPFTTLVRGNTCVFQDEDNRCRVYAVRPSACRDFPYDKKRRAPFVERLCVLYKDFWPSNSPVKKIYKQREKK